MNSKNAKLMNNIGLASSPQLQPMGTVAHYVLASQNGRADRACGPARRPSWFVATARGVCALGVWSSLPGVGTGTGTDGAAVAESPCGLHHEHEGDKGGGAGQAQDGGTH
jgi:hypothetical protein